MRKPNYVTMNLLVNYDIKDDNSIEREIEKAETTKQPIETSSPTIYTPRKDGVRPEYDIRTDRWDIAYNAMNKVSASYRAKRAENINPSAEGSDNNTKQNIAEA